MKQILISFAVLVIICILITVTFAQNVKDNSPETNDHKKMSELVLPITVKVAHTTQDEKFNYQNAGPTYNKETKDWFRILQQDPTAVCTLILAAITLLLVIASFKQVILFRKELILGKRPRLRVRNVVVRQPIHPRNQPEIFANGTLVSGQFYIDNIGGTDAYIIELGSWVIWNQKPLPMERPYEGKNGNYPLSTKLRLRPGESLPIVFLGDNFMGEEGNDILHGTGNWNLYVMGWIEFIDDLKIKRRTAFCRKYRASDHRFVAVDNEDYEHNN